MNAKNEAWPRGKRAPLAWRLAALVVLALFAGCQSQSAATTTPPTTLSRPAYHFTLRLPANWVVFEEHDDPTAASPYFLDIQRASVAPAAANSLLNLQIIKTTTPGINAVIAALPKNPQYHAAPLNGQTVYIGTPFTYFTQDTTSPPGSATPLPGTPGTVTHTDYEVATPALLYTFYTEAVAGDHADADLQAMVQSLTISP